MHAFNDLVPKFETFIQTFPIFSNYPASLYEPCVYALDSGGKRVRPILTLLASELFANEIPNDAYIAALSFELFHNFTLVHDDIMDNSLIRRGRPSVFNKFGQTAAILSGDVMNICAYNVLGKIENPIHLQKLLKLFNTTAIEICEGQQLDMDFETITYITPAQYIEMIKLKTSVLLAACLKAGGILVDASENDVNHLYDFGINIGLAFQIQDDYLDTFGTEEAIGKLPGGDIRNNKKTLLWIFLHEQLIKHDKLSQLEKIVHLPAAEKLDHYKALLIEYGVDELIKEEIVTYSNVALAHLASIEVDRDRKIALTDLANMLIKRKN